MLIQKVFHIRQPLDETQARLSKSRSFSQPFDAQGAAGRAKNGRSLWDALSVMGLRGPLELELLPSDDKRQVLFRSSGGEMELCGLMELLPVRDRLTEVQLTLEYDIQSPIRRALDRALGAMNRRVDRHILAMKFQMEADDAPEIAERLAPSRLIPTTPVAALGEPSPAR